MAGARTITVTKNEILAGLNKPEDYLLVVVEVEFVDGQTRAGAIHYMAAPFQKEPDFAATSVNYDWHELATGATG